MECVICLRHISNSVAISPCLHRFCETCITTSLTYKVRCPICRRVPTSLEVQTSKYESTLTHFVKDIACAVRPPEARLGITLSQLSLQHGVKIVRLHRRQSAYASGLRKGDVLIRMNNIPCTTVYGVIGVLDALKHQAKQENATRVATCLVIRRTRLGELLQRAFPRAFTSCEKEFGSSLCPGTGRRSCT